MPRSQQQKRQIEQLGIMKRTLRKRRAGKQEILARHRSRSQTFLFRRKTKGQATELPIPRREVRRKNATIPYRRGSTYALSQVTGCTIDKQAKKGLFSR